MGLALLIVLRFVVGLALLRHYDRLSVCARVQMMIEDVFPVESELTLKKKGRMVSARNLLGVQRFNHCTFASASGGVRGYNPDR